MNTPDFIPVLAHGSHADPKQGACVMEMVAFLAGEPHTDQPKCVMPVLRNLGINVNDFVSDDNRNRIALLIPAFMNSNDMNQSELENRVQQEVLPAFYNWYGDKKAFQHQATSTAFRIIDPFNAIKNEYEYGSFRRENKVYDEAAILYLEMVMKIVAEMKGEEPIQFEVMAEHPSQKANA
jgi:hypothetical protein